MANHSKRGRPAGSPNKDTIKVVDIQLQRNSIEKQLEKFKDENGKLDKNKFIRSFIKDSFALASALDYNSVEDMLLDFKRDLELYSSYQKYLLMQKSKWLKEADISTREKLIKETGVANSVKEEGIKIEFNFDMKVLDLVKNDLEEEVE